MRRWKLITVSGIAAMLVLVVGGLALAAPQDQSPSDAPDVARGSQVYRNNCAACHGRQGEGALGIPNLAGAAGHVQQLGIPAEEMGPGMIKMLRDGIAGNMPAFPPTMLSDDDIANLGAYVFTLPPTTGANLYTANCALCHGLQGQGAVGPPLLGAADKFAKMGRSKLQALTDFPGLVRNGIPGKMPGNPQLADAEVASMGDFLWNLGSWEAEFQSSHGRAPSTADRADREWSLQFAQRSGRSPTSQDWIAHDAESLSYQQVTALDVNLGAPPAGGWKWAVMRRATGANEEIEAGQAGGAGVDVHGNDWVFHVLKGSTEIWTPGGSVALGAGEAELLTARQKHAHRFVPQSEILGFRPHSAAARPPDEFHRGEKLLFSDAPLELTDGVNYRIRVREFTLGRGQRTGNIEAGPSFLYVSEGTLVMPGQQTSPTSAGQILSLSPTQTLVVSNSGTAQLKFVLVDLH